MKTLKYILILLALLIGCSIANAQMTTQTSLLVNVQSSTFGGPKFTVLTTVSDQLSKFDAGSVDVGDKLYVLDGSECYELTVDSILTALTSILEVRVVDSTGLLANVTTGQAILVKPYANKGVPFIPSGTRSDLASCILQRIAGIVDSISTNTPISSAVQSNCSYLIYKAAHGWTQGTPIRWDGNTWVSMVGVYGDSLVADLVVTDSVHVDTVYASVCGIYDTSLPDGDYFQTDQSPGFSTTADTVTIVLFNISNGKLIINSFLGFTERTNYSAGVGILIENDTIKNTGVLTNTLHSGDVSGFYNSLSINANVIDSTHIKQNAVSSNNLTATGIVAGSYTSADLTVGADGRIIEISNGTGGTPETIDNNYIPVMRNDTLVNSILKDTTGVIIVTGNRGVVLPSRTTAGRPIAPFNGETGFNSTTNYSEIYNGTNWLQTAFPVGATNNTLFHDGTNWVSNSRITWNGSNTLTVNGSGNTTFSLGADTCNFHLDAVSTGGNLLYRASTTAVLSLPVAGTNGLIIRPSTASETTTSRLLLRGASTNSHSINNLGSITLTGVVTAYGLNLENTITPDPSNNILGAVSGSLRMRPSFTSAGIPGNQKVVVNVMSVEPIISRNTGNDTISVGLRISPNLTGTTAWTGVENLSSVGKFLNSATNAISHHQGNFGIGNGTLNPTHSLHVGDLMRLDAINGGPATHIMGRDSNNVLTAVTLSGATLTSGVLGIQNLGSSDLTNTSALRTYNIPNGYAMRFADQGGGNNFLVAMDNRGFYSNNHSPRFLVQMQDTVSNNFSSILVTPDTVQITSDKIIAVLPERDSVSTLVGYDPTAKQFVSVDRQRKGSVSENTDASGDVTVSVTMPDATFVVTVQVTGTTLYHAVVHDKSTAGFKVRLFDSSGVVLPNSTAVTFDYTLINN